MPAGVEMIAAGKLRSISQIKEAIRAGVRIIGENYVQEAEDKFRVIGRAVRWHLIGHLQSNKVKRAVEIFDMIETIDSFKIIRQIDKACGVRNRVMPVLIEINSAREEQKTGILPEDAQGLIRQACGLRYVKIVGLMTMGPNLANPQELRPYFRQTRELFQRIKARGYPGVEMRYLSMGMSDSYRVAVEEGANLVRIGTAIFGKRKA